MTIGEILVSLISNLGVTWPQLVLIITALGVMIFMAVELRFGLMMMFFMFAFETLVFWYSMNNVPDLGITTVDLTLSTSVTLASFVIMTLSLLITKSKQGYNEGII